MKNLKRALSFALATVMLIGMMVVGVSAADFGDADEIVNTEAVNTMVQLGIIKGKDNGDFDPEGIVTRAEMAKMICVALNGGKDPNLAGGGLFADTKGHWASGYIDFCANRKIVSGDTAGYFNPDKTVTGTEAAKMILIALGYSAENEKFVNDANWALNINVIASQKGLYEDVNVLPELGLSRDNAAQMIYNGLYAEMVEYDYKLTTVDGDLQTVAIAQGNGNYLINDKFGLQIQKGYLAEVTYNSTTEKYTYTVLNDGTGITTSPITTNSVAVTDKADFTDLYGDYVKMLYKNTANGKVLYGIYSASGDILIAKKGDMTVADDDKSFKVDDVKYNVAATVSGMTTYCGTETDTGASTVGSAGEADTLKFIDENSDGKFDYAVVTESTVAKVTFVGKDTVTIGTASYDLEDDVASIYDGVAKNDYAVVTKNDFLGTYTIEKADVITGKIEAVKSTDTVKVGGKWYEKSTSASALTATHIGKTYELAVVGGYYYDSKLTLEEGVTSDVLYISAADPKSETLDTVTVKAKAYFTDGSSEIITVSKVDDNKINAETVGTTADTATDFGTNYTGNKVTAGAMYRYVKNSDGTYKLYHLAATNDVTKAGYGTYAQQTNAAAIVDASEDKFVVSNVNYTIADDSVFFVQTTKDGKADVKVLTGKTIKTWSSDFGGAAQVLANKVNGFNTVRVGAVIDGSAAAISNNADKYYGYITSTPYIAENADGDNAIFATVWTKDGAQDIEITSYENSGTTSVSTTVPAIIAKGVFIVWELDNDGYAVKADTINVKYAVTALDGKNLQVKANGNGSEYAVKTDDDTVYVYVNSADVKGVEGGELVIANETAIDGMYVPNVVVYDGDNSLSGGETLTVIFVDIANSMKTSSTFTTAVGTTLSNADVTFGTAAGETSTLFTSGENVAKANVKAVAADASAGVSEVVFKGALAVEVIQETSNDNLQAGDIIRVVAENGAVTDYTVDTGDAT